MVFREDGMRFLLYDEMIRAILAAGASPFKYQKLTCPGAEVEDDPPLKHLARAKGGMTTILDFRYDPSNGTPA